MTLQEIKSMAQTLGIKPGKLKKLDIVREIQKAEGNFPCFGTAVDFCDQSDCVFRSDCLGQNA